MDTQKDMALNHTSGANRGTTKYTAEEAIRAIQLAHGVLASAAKAMGCSRTTLHKMVREMPTVRAAYDEANETLLDFTEQQLFKLIGDGNVAAIIFTLKCKGRPRGWIEKQDIVVNEPEIDAAIDNELARLAGKRQVAAVASAAVDDAAGPDA